MCSFVKKVGVAKRVKSAQSTSKIRKNRGFSSDLVHFLTQVGGAQALPTEYVTTPLPIYMRCKSYIWGKTHVFTLHLRYIMARKKYRITLIFGVNTYRVDTYHTYFFVMEHLFGHKPKRPNRCEIVTYR